LLPDWLCRPEDYDPPADRDRFIDKSIISFFGVLGRIRARGGNHSATLGVTIHPALRLVSCLAMVLLTSLSRNIYFLGVVGTLELLIISSLSGQRIANILKAGCVAALFAFIIFLPSALWGNWPGVIVVAVKVLLSVMAAALVSATTDWNSITRGFATLRLPDIFILVLDLAIKYILLLGGLVLDMLYALKLRSVGKNESKTNSLAGIAGTTFLKSKEAADEMYAAMECRGFSGSYRVGQRSSLRIWDYLFILACLCLAFLFFYLQGL